MKFSDLPSRAKLRIFDHAVTHTETDKAKTLATVNSEFANLVSMSLSKSWTSDEQNQSKWINLPPATNTLKFEKFSKTIPVLRVDTREPKIIEKIGFRRRGIQPQFLPDGFYSYKEYSDCVKSKPRPLSPVSEQVPWRSMVCTWNFSENKDRVFKEADEWEPSVESEEDKQSQDDSTTWIYFAAIHEGIVNPNAFDERTVFGILSSDIVGAISFHPKNGICYWINQNCTLKNFEPALYEELYGYLVTKIGLNNSQANSPKKIKITELATEAKKEFDPNDNDLEHGSPTHFFSKTHSLKEEETDDGELQKKFQRRSLSPNT